MSITKLSLGLCALVFTALLAPLARSHAAHPSVPTYDDLQPTAMVAGGGDQVSTSQNGDLKLVDGSGQTSNMTNIKKDSDGNITEFYVFPTTYKWNSTEKRYNPTTIEMNYFKFKYLSPGRYSWDKCNASGGVMNSGSLDT